MGACFIFEDHGLTPSSKLLSCCTNGNNIHFSGGNSTVYEEAKRLQSKGNNNVFVFFDAALDNSFAMRKYMHIYNTIDNNKDTGIYLVPIICVEQIILDMLWKFEYISSSDTKTAKRLQCSVVDFDYNELCASIPNAESVGSIEHLFKYILNNTKQRCLRNTNYGKNTIFGKFYTSECNCEYPYCKLNIDDSIRLKAERLYTSLPVFTVINDEHFQFLKNNDINLTKINLDDLRDNRRDLFKKLSKSMGKRMIRVQDYSKYMPE